MISNKACPTLATYFVIQTSFNTSVILVYTMVTEKSPFILASIAMDGIMIIPFTKVNVYVKTYMYMYMYVHIGLSLYLVFLSMVVL